MPDHLSESLPQKIAPPFGLVSHERLVLRQASFAYPDFSLRPLDFAVHAGEILTIVGPNASGKTTLLRLLSGICRPRTGQVLLDGHEISQLDVRERARKIAVVQQESPLLFPIRVREFVMQGRHPHLRPFEFASERDCSAVEWALVSTETTALAGRLVQELSGGEKQRVVLARALAQQPEVLLLDEPTLHLDIGFQVELLRGVRRLANGIRYAVVVVTHELNLAAEFADRILLLHRGELCRLGTPEEVFEQALLERIFGTALRVDRDPASGRPRIVLGSEAPDS